MGNSKIDADISVAQKCHSYVACKHIYWMFPMGLKGQTALVRLFSALLGRHHNIHPKHPNHSLTIAVTMAVGIFVNFSTPK